MDIEVEQQPPEEEGSRVRVVSVLGKWSLRVQTGGVRGFSLKVGEKMKNITS